MDISLDSSMVELLTSDAGVPSLIPSPAMYFNLYLPTRDTSFVPKIKWKSIKYKIFMNSNNKKLLPRCEQCDS